MIIKRDLVHAFYLTGEYKMKVENLAAKRFFIQCKDELFDLLPASGAVELPTGADKDYLNALAKQGRVKIHDSLEIEDAVILEDEDLETLREEYEILSGKKADGRWSDERLQEEIDNLSE